LRRRRASLPLLLYINTPSRVYSRKIYLKTPIVRQRSSIMWFPIIYLEHHADLIKSTALISNWYMRQGGPIVRFSNDIFTTN
jgi:hypothetical protein